MNETGGRQRTTAVCRVSEQPSCPCCPFKRGPARNLPIRKGHNIHELYVKESSKNKEERGECSLPNTATHVL